MDRRTIALVWCGGIVLMAVVYLIGPQNFIESCAELLARFAAFLDAFFETLLSRAFDWVRAAAIALYAVFVVLSLLAMRQGLRVGGTLVVVSILFLLLIRMSWYDPGTKWLGAAVVNAIAAGMISKRLVRSGPFQPGRGSPWGRGFQTGPDRPDSQRVP